VVPLSWIQQLVLGAPWTFNSLVNRRGLLKSSSHPKQHVFSEYPATITIACPEGVHMSPCLVQFVLWIPGPASSSFTISFYTCFPDLLIYQQPAFIQARIKIVFPTWKLVALVAKINLLFLVTWAYSTVLKQLTLFVATPLAIFRGKRVQHLLESGVVAENRVLQKRLKSFGIDAEISQFFFKIETVFPYVSLHMCKASFTTEAARGYGFLNFAINHGLSPFVEMSYFSWGHYPAARGGVA
jgi:hypothetical protein